MSQTTFSDLERNNKTCMYAHLIDSSIMTLFCILQVLSGLQTWFCCFLQFCTFYCHKRSGFFIRYSNDFNYFRL